MLILTKHLKEQSELANRIIKKDTEVRYYYHIQFIFNIFDVADQQKTASNL